MSDNGSRVDKVVAGDDSDHGEPDLARSLEAYVVRMPAHGRTTTVITDAIREAILDGLLAPTTWLREGELAATFGVSRTPVRDALLRLSDEGLVVKVPHQGSMVASLSTDDILALYVVRENLEGLATRLATARSTPGLLRRLDEIQAAMTRAAKDEDMQSLSSLNLEFHRALRKAAANQYLDRFLEQVEQAWRRLARSTYVTAGRPLETLDEHQAIIDAIRSGDPLAAERSAVAHMRRGRQVRLDELAGG